MDRLISEFEVIRAIEKFVDNIFTKNMGALIKDIKAIPTAESCEGCIHEKTGNNSTYPCSHCSRCYTDKYKAESEDKE